MVRLTWYPGYEFIFDVQLCRQDVQARVIKQACSTELHPDFKSSSKDIVVYRQLLSNLDPTGGATSGIVILPSFHPPDQLAVAVKNLDNWQKWTKSKSQGVFGLPYQAIYHIKDSHIAKIVHRNGHAVEKGFQQLASNY